MIVKYLLLFFTLLVSSPIFSDIEKLMEAIKLGRISKVELLKYIKSESALTIEKAGKTHSVLTEMLQREQLGYLDCLIPIQKLDELYHQVFQIGNDEQSARLEYTNNINKAWSRLVSAYEEKGAFYDPYQECKDFIDKRNELNIGGWGVFHFMAISGRHDLFKILKDDFKHCFQSQDDGNTPIHLALEFGHFALANAMLLAALRKELDIKCKNHEGNDIFKLLAKSLFVTIQPLQINLDFSQIYATLI